MSSRIVLCVCVLCVFLFLSSLHHSRLGAALNVLCQCGARWLFDIYTVPLSGASDRPESIWNPSCTQHPLESTSGTAIRGKPLRHRNAAAIHFLGRELGPPKSGSGSPSALARILNPTESGSSSSVAIQLLQSQNGVDLRNAQERKILGMLIARYAMNNPKKQRSSSPWSSSAAMKSGSSPKTSSTFGGNSGKKSNVGAASEVARDGTLNKRHDSTTESHLDFPRLVASSALDEGRFTCWSVTSFDCGGTCSNGSCGQTSNQTSIVSGFRLP